MTHAGKDLTMYFCNKPSTQRRNKKQNIMTHVEKDLIMYLCNKSSTQRSDKKRTEMTHAGKDLTMYLLQQVIHTMEWQETNWNDSYR